MQSRLHSLANPEAADWPLVPPSHEHASAGTGTVLLKEYLPGARSVACNEMQALVHLAGACLTGNGMQPLLPSRGTCPLCLC